MIRVLRPLSALLAAGAAAAVAFAPAALAEQPTRGSVWAYDLTVTDAHSAERSVTLHCSPAGSGGSHPSAADACAAIAEAGSVGAVAGRGGACTMEYRPVTATADGRKLSGSGPDTDRFTEEYSNPCTLQAAKGPVFDF